MVKMIKPDKEKKSDKEINLAEEKKRLRKEILSIRNAIPPMIRQELSDKILQKVYDLEEYKSADVILVYADYQSEVITSPLIEKSLIDGKKVFCPKVSGNDMDFYQIKELSELGEGYKGIREPVSGERFSDEMNSLSGPLVIMPGVVFDRNCHRIGYGKGFYDRFLTRMSESGLSLHAIGLGFECQLVDEVPSEIHDISLDMIVTENDVYGMGD